MKTSGSNRILSVTLFLVGLVLYIGILGFRAYGARHNNDFAHMYAGMQALYDGTSPYPARNLIDAGLKHGMSEQTSFNPYVYLPFTGLTLGFMRGMSYEMASRAWFLVNHFCLLGSLAILSLQSPRYVRLLTFSLLLIAVALYHPAWRTFTAGQLNFVLLVSLAGALHLLHRGYGGWAGALLGFAAMFKLAPAIFLLYFIARRNWRALAAMAGTIFVLMLLCLIVVGLEVHLDFLPMLRQMGYGKSTWEEYGARFWLDPWNQSLNSFFTHVLVQGNRVTSPWVWSTQQVANGVTILITISLLAAWAWSFITETRAKREHQLEEAAFGMTVLLMLLIPSLMWDHYLVMLFVPAVVMLRVSLVQRWWIVAVVILLCLGISAVPWNPGNQGYRTGAGIVIMSLKLWPTLFLLVLTIVLTRLTVFSGEKLAPANSAH